MTPVLPIGARRRQKLLWPSQLFRLLKPMLQTSRLPVDRLFRAFSDRTRLRILHLLQGGELCVCDLVSILRVPSRRRLGIWPTCVVPDSSASGRSSLGSTPRSPSPGTRFTRNCSTASARASPKYPS